MIVVINHFIVPAGYGQRLEEGFRHSDGSTNEVPGFIDSCLLKEGASADGTEEYYASMSRWADRAALDAWTASEGFRRAHAGTGNSPIKSKLTVYDVVAGTPKA
ncbi:MAG: antibiotic biosynthesis monooxygenase family protein [Thermomicrobiales bacterium]